MVASAQELEVLFQQHESLIHWCLKPFRTYRSSRYDKEDLEQVAYAAFLEAVKLYDPDKGKLSTLVARYVPYRVRRFLRQNVSDFTVPLNGTYDASIIPGSVSLDIKAKTSDLEDLSNMYGKVDETYGLVDLISTVEHHCHSGCLDGDEVFNQWKMWRLGGYTHKEIADQYNLQRGTVAERLALVERKLKQQEGNNGHS